MSWPNRLKKQLSAFSMPARMELVAEAERGQFAHRMRQQRDADAEFSYFGSCFIDAARDPARVQVQCERKAANPSADDGNAHILSFVMPRESGAPSRRQLGSKIPKAVPTGSTRFRG